MTEGHGSAARGLRRVFQGALVGAAAAALAAALWVPGLLEVFEAKTWDLRARLLERPGKATGQVVTILLDQYSLTWASKQGVGWPWPRSLYAMIADFCRAGGARALVFDVLYTEETNEDVGQDQELARGFSENGRVVGAMNLARNPGQGSASSWPPDVPAPGLSVAGLDTWQPRNLSFPYAQFPIAAVGGSVRALANTNLPPIRRTTCTAGSRCSTPLAGTSCRPRRLRHGRSETRPAPCGLPLARSSWEALPSPSTRTAAQSCASADPA